MKTPLIMLAALGMSAPALAGDDAPVRSAINVSYDDLDLSSAKGQKILAKRLEFAARRVCKLDASITGTRIRDRDAQRCYAAAKQRSKQQFAAVVEQHRKGG